MYVDDPIIVNEGTSGRLCVYWDDYNATNYLHIRYWYECKKDGIWKPGRKGIAIREEQLPLIFEALGKAAEGKSSERRPE